MFGFFPLIVVNSVAVLGLKLRVLVDAPVRGSEQEKEKEKEKEKSTLGIRVRREGKFI